MAKRDSYRPEWDKKVYSLAARGYNNTEIANKLGVITETFSAMRKKYPSLQKSLDDARAERLEDVEKSLFKDIEGYFVEEVHQDFGVFRGAKTLRSEKVCKKWIPPNAQLKKLYLQAIAPEKYGKIDNDKSDVNVNIVKPVRVVFKK